MYTGNKFKILLSSVYYLNLLLIVMQLRQVVIIILISSITSFQGLSQSCFEVTINHYPDTSVILASYYGEKNIIVDTAYSDHSKFTFYKQDYPGGVYMLASQTRKKLFEFIINDECGFSLHTDAEVPFDVKVDSSNENSIFYDYQSLRNSIHQKIRQYADTTPEALLSLSENLKKELSLKEDSIINSFPDLFISKLILAQKEIPVPDSLQNDSLKTYLYYKKHYWDHFNLSDERFIRTPLLEKKLNYYFDHVIYLSPDSAINAIDTIISRARPSDEMVSFLLWYFMSRYQNPKYMGFDKVFVHLVDDYFLKEDVLNMTPSIREKLRERSDKLKPLLLGEIAPNLNLIDTNNSFRSFRSLKSDYVLLLFWDYNCPVCKNTIKELKKLLDTTNYDLTVYAINVNGDLDKWKKSVKELNTNWIHVNGTISTTLDFHDIYDINSTPKVYLLNSGKKIIAKNFKVDQIFAIIDNQFMINKRIF